MNVLDLLVEHKALGAKFIAVLDELVDIKTSASIKDAVAKERHPSSVARKLVRPGDNLLREGHLFVSCAEVESVCDELELSKEHREFIDFALPIENYNVILDDGDSRTPGYVTSLTGTFRGLGQFSRSTWRSVVGKPFPLVADTRLSIKAMCDLYDDSKRHFAASGGQNFDAKVAYLYHNQGAGSAVKFLQTGQLVYPKQSTRALDVFTEITMDGRNYGFV